MKKYYIFILSFIAIVMTSCDKEVIETNPSSDGFSKYVNSKIESDVISNGEYLEFKSVEVFDSIRKILDAMSSTDFQKWQQNIGFKSAKSYMNEFESKSTNSKSIDEYNSILKCYSNYLHLDSNQIVRYNFYASSLDRILNIEGIVKIGKSLYKFTETNEYISFDGNKERIEKAIKNEGLKSAIDVEDKLLCVVGTQNNSLKSSYTQIVTEGTKTVLENNRRLIYSIQKIVYSSPYAFDVYTGQVAYKWGYELNLTMQQQKYDYPFLSSTKQWMNMSCSYYVRDVNINWWAIGVFLPGEYIPGYNGSLANQDFGLTNDEVKYYFVTKEWRGYYQGQADFNFHLNFSFYSSGIGVENKIALSL